MDNSAPCSAYREMAVSWNKWFVTRLRHSGLTGILHSSCGFATWEAALFPSPSNLWTLVYSSQNIPWEPPSLEVIPPSPCVGRRTVSWGPQRWARSGSVVSKLLGSQGPGGSLGCSEAQPCPTLPFVGPCVGEDRRGSIGDRASNTHKHSTAVLTTSMFATEKPRPLAKIDASFQT